MSWTSTTAPERALQAARTEEEYLLHEAALEWDLTDSIIIQKREDIQSQINWRNRFDPFEHQVQNLITFCRRLPVTLLADDVGLGKTISAGLILGELMIRKRVPRALVLCPKLLGPQWVRELDEKFGITAVIAVGKHLDAQLERGESVVVTTYESATKRLVSGVPINFDMVILDEAHKLRNLYGDSDAPLLATNVRQALNDRLFKYVLMLTATPIQNRIWDLYSLIDCLTVAKGHKNPFGPPDKFDKNYLVPGSKGRQLLNPKRFQGILREYLVRSRRVDVGLLFPARKIEMRGVTLSQAEQRLIALVKTEIGFLKPLTQFSLARSMMSSPPALAAQLENMASKPSNPSLKDIARQARDLSNHCMQPAKLEHLMIFCDELRSKNPHWRVVIFTLRIATQAMIGEAFKRKGIAFGYIRGGQAKENQKVIDAFFAKPPGIHALISTDAGAEGVNLQAANVLVNYDLPWNPMVVEQRIGRIQRLGSEHPTVEIVNLVAAGTVEDSIVRRLIEKLQSIEQTIGDVESILSTASNKKDPRSFEEIIGEMVVRSLLGQDVKEEARLKEESIDRARKLLDEQAMLLNATLGTPAKPTSSGPKMPNLARRPPAMSAEDFVLRAKRVEGATVKQSSPKIYEVIPPDRQPAELITFDEATFDENMAQAAFQGRLRLYQPGKKDFERLVEKWVNRYGHYIRDCRPTTQADCERVARQWCKTIGEAELISCQVLTRKRNFQGHTRVKVKALNGVDSYEKLIDSGFHPKGHNPISDELGSDHPMRGPVLPEEVLTDYAVPLLKAIEADREIGEFHRFYSERQIEELNQTGGNPHLESKIRKDFTISVQHEIAGIQGVCYEEVELQVDFTIEGKGPYKATLRIIPASGQILVQPELGECDERHLKVPVHCLFPCSLTHKPVLLHQLEYSPDRKRRVRTSRMVTCQITNQRVVDDEVETSVFSKIVGLRSYFIKCQFTKEWIIRDTEAARSSYSGKVGRKDRLKPSGKSPERLGVEEEFGFCAITKKPLLLDELEECAVDKVTVDKVLLQTSARSKRVALPRHFELCQETNAELLKDEIGTCCQTGNRVDLTLLSASEDSGALGLTRLMEQCQETGKRVFSYELETCPVTGKRALCSAFEICGESGTRAVGSAMVVCSVSRRRVLQNLTGKSDYSSKSALARLLVASANPKNRKGLPEELVECQESQGLFLPDELDKSVVSGKVVDRDLLIPSDRSKKLALLSEMKTCEESEKLLLPSEVARCAITGKLVDCDLLSRSEESEKEFGLTRLMQQCEVTKKSVLPKELSESANPTKRKALHRKMIRCQESRALFLPDEVAQSVISGKRVDRNLLVASTRSQQLALPSEMVICQETNLPFLPSEVARCVCSGKTVDERLLIPSGWSKKLFLQCYSEKCEATYTVVMLGELETCELTGTRVLPKLLGICAETKKKVLLSRLVKCEKSKEMVFDTETSWSDFSALRVRKSLLSRSAKPPYRQGIAEEFVLCQESGQRLLGDEVGTSVVSGKLVNLDLLIPSTRSEQLALPSEMKTCEETGKPFLPSEVGCCVYSTKTVDERLLIQSGWSNKFCLQRYTDKCAATHTVVMLGELEKCEATEVMVLPSVLGICAETKKKVLLSLLVECQKSKEMVLETETARSDFSRLRVRKSLLTASAKAPYRQGIDEEFVLCQKSDHRLLRDEVGTSVVSGKIIDLELLVPSMRSDKLALAAEMRICEETQRLLLPSEIEQCSETKKWVDDSLLEMHDLSHQFALKRLMQRCAETSKNVLIRELEQCQLSEDWVLISELRTCVVTGTRALPRLLQRSDVSGKYAIPSEVFRCAISGKWALRSEMVHCNWLESKILKTLGGTCTLTGLVFAKKFLQDSQLIPLNDLLIGKVGDSMNSRPFLGMLRSLDKLFQDVIDVKAIKSIGGGHYAFCGELLKRWLKKTRYIGGVFKLRGTGEIIGTMVRGYRETYDFIIEEEFEF